MRLLATTLLLAVAHLCCGQSYTFVFLHKKVQTDSVSKEALAKLMEGHMANIERLAKEKKLLVAGPFDGGGGLFILNTTSKKEAEEWLSSDPGIKAKRWNVEILSYTPIIGSVCQVSEPYEMVTYHFARISLTQKSKTKKHRNEYDTALKSFLHGEEIVTHGMFSSSDQIVILKNHKGNKPVNSALIKQDEKKLWIAEGSFCEK